MKVTRSLGRRSGSLVLAALLVNYAAGALAASMQDPTPFRVYVTNEGSGDVTVIDGATREVVATIPLGKRPRGIVADALNRRLFVAISGSPLAGPGVDEKSLPPPDKSADGIAVVDGSTNRLVRVLRGSSDPEQLALSRDGRTLYVASEDTAQGLAIDSTNGKVQSRFAVGGQPEGVGVNPARKVVYFTSETDNSLTVVDASRSRRLRSVPVGERPRDVAVSPDGTRVYVSGENDASVRIIDGRSDEPLGTLRVPGKSARPKGLAISHDGKRLFVATGRGGTVVAFNTETLEAEGTVPVGQRPWGIVLSPDDRYLFVANGPSDDLSVVDTESLTLVATLKVGSKPWGVAVLSVDQ